MQISHIQAENKSQLMLNPLTILKSIHELGPFCGPSLHSINTMPALRFLKMRNGNEMNRPSSFRFDFLAYSLRGLRFTSIY